MDEDVLDLLGLEEWEVRRKLMDFPDDHPVAVMLSQLL